MNFFNKIERHINNFARKNQPMIPLKNRKAIQKMRLAGRIVAEAFDLLEVHIKPGIRLSDLPPGRFPLCASKHENTPHVHFGVYPLSIITRSHTRGGFFIFFIF